jgi:hypothetical protein
MCRRRARNEHANIETNEKANEQQEAATPSYKKVLEAHLALRDVATSPVVPVRMKRPLVINFFYSKIATDRLLPVMASSAYDEAKIGIHAIAMSKPLTEPPKKIVLKRRHTTAVETPVCARISDTHVLTAVPRDGPAARIKFTFAKAGLRCVADEKDKKRKSQKTSTSIITAVGADVIKLDLPSDVSAYNCPPWWRVRDLIAQAHFKAEQMSSGEEERPFDIKKAMSHMETNAFKWDLTHRPFLHAFLFVVWTTGEKKDLKYHLNIVQGKRLCMHAGNLKPAPAPKRRRA